VARRTCSYASRVPLPPKHIHHPTDLPHGRAIPYRPTHPIPPKHRKTKPREEQRLTLNPSSLTTPHSAPLSIIHLAISTLSTTYKGVSPSSSLRFISPPTEIKYSRISVWAYEADACIGVYEFGSGMLGDRFSVSIRNWILALLAILLRPLLQTRIVGVV